MLKNRWWGLLCLCMTMGLHGCPLEVEQEIGNNEDDAGQGEGGQGGQGGNAEGGEGGQGAEGGQGGQGADGGQGGQGAEGGQGGGEGGQGGGDPQQCPEGYDEIDGPNQCDEGQECFPLDDGRWCRGPVEIGECPDGYELAEECRPDADCIPLADGLFCVGEPQVGECPDGFEPVEECPADAECVLTNEGQMCARFGGPQGCPDGFVEVDDPDECWGNDEPGDPAEPNIGECIEVDGRLCRPIHEPACPDGFELTDNCDGEPGDPDQGECFPIDNGLFCQWIGDPPGCPQGFVEVQDPDECFEGNRDLPNDPNGVGDCIEVNGRLCRQADEPPQCPDGFELTDWCEDDGNAPGGAEPGDAEQCFPIGEGLFCRWVGEPQGCPQGFVEVQDPDECFEEGQDPANPDFGRCIEIDGRLCREINEPQDCPPGFELTDWCDEDRGDQCFPIGDGLFCQWNGDPQGCPQGFEPVNDPDECWWDGDERDPNDPENPDEAAPPQDPNLGQCIEVNGMLCRPVDDQPECPPGFELTDWCGDGPDGEPGDEQCFPIDDGLFCRWVGQPAGCPAGTHQVDEDECFGDNDFQCDCMDANGDGQCDLWCRPDDPNPECPEGFELTDWCGQDGNDDPAQDECFPIDDGLFCRWVGEPQGCPDGFEPGCDADRGGECIQFDGQVCQQVEDEQMCPEGFVPSNGCDAGSPNECFELDNGMYCQWVGGPQGCPPGFDEVDQCDPAQGECFQAEDGSICQEFREP